MGEVIPLSRRSAIVTKLNSLLSTQSSIPEATLTLLTGLSIPELNKCFEVDSSDDDLFLTMQIYAFNYYGCKMFSTFMTEHPEVLSGDTPLKELADKQFLKGHDFLHNLFFFISLRAEKIWEDETDLNGWRRRFEGGMNLGRTQTLQDFPEYAPFLNWSHKLDRPLELMLQEIRDMMVKAYLSRKSTVALLEVTLRPLFGDATEEAIQRLKTY